jgi:hypothetical protein
MHGNVNGKIISEIISRYPQATQTKHNLQLKLRYLLLVCLYHTFIYCVLLTLKCVVNYIVSPLSQSLKLAYTSRNM